MTGRLGRHRAGCLPAETRPPGRGVHDLERSTSRPPRGITLTEILISILILGVGLVSLATLFPIGLLRLREAQRQTRSAYLFESATADAAARGLLSTNSFTYADLLNVPNWLTRLVPVQLTTPACRNGFDPLTQDARVLRPDAVWTVIPYAPRARTQPRSRAFCQSGRLRPAVRL